MGQFQKNITGAPTRRFVLADKFTPKAIHSVDVSETIAFGDVTPPQRSQECANDAAAETAPDTAPDGELQNSIKSILAQYK